jgi:hypothetical protein
VEAGYVTSTTALRVATDDGKGTQCLGVYTTVAESSREGYGSERAVLLMMMMVVLRNVVRFNDR